MTSVQPGLPFAERTRQSTVKCYSEKPIISRKSTYDSPSRRSTRNRKTIESDEENIDQNVIVKSQAIKIISRGLSTPKRSNRRDPVSVIELSSDSEEKSLEEIEEGI